MKRAILAALMVLAILVAEVAQFSGVQLPNVMAQTDLAQLIEDETLEKITVTVDGNEYAIVTLRRYIDPADINKPPADPPYWPLKVYVDADGNPVSDASVLRKIMMIERALRFKQEHGLKAVKQKLDEVSWELKFRFYVRGYFFELLFGGYITRFIARNIDLKLGPERVEMLLDLGYLSHVDEPELSEWGANSDQILEILSDPVMEAVEWIRIDLRDAKADYKESCRIEVDEDLTDFAWAYEYLKHAYSAEARVGPHWSKAFNEVNGSEKVWYKQWWNDMWWSVKAGFNTALNYVSLHAWDLFKGAVLDYFFHFNDVPWVNEFRNARLDELLDVEYWLQWELQVDPLNQAAQYSQELANQIKEEILVPDLTVLPVTIGSSSVEAGESINVTFTIENIGGAPSGSFANRVFLAIPPNKWYTDIPLGTFYMDSLDANSSSPPTTVEVFIPQSVPAGEYYVTVYTDAFRVIEEAENLGLGWLNNIGSTSPQMLTVIEPEEIDLTVTSPDPPSKLELNETTSVSFTVQNVGSTSSGPFTNRVFLSSRPERVDISLGEFDMASFDPDESRPATVHVTIPPELPSNEYYITVFADGLHTIAETNESNNIKSTPNKIPVETTPSPAIGSSSSITFPTAVEGGSDPASQKLSIWNSGGGTLDWSVSDDAAWLTLEPLSDVCTVEVDNVVVSAGISGMSADSYTATITISATDATPQTVPVSLTINPYENLAAPTMYEPSVSGNSYTISWSEVGGASSYTLQEDTSATFPSPTEYTPITTSRFFEGKAVGTYYYQVKAVTEGGGSGWSGTNSVTIYANYPPGEITNIAPPDGAPDQLLTVTLQWDASHPGGEVLTYDVYLMPFYSETLYSFHIVSPRQSGKTYTATDLEFNTDYSWAVRAWDETGDNHAGQIWHFTTIADINPPSGAISINDGAATTDSHGVTLYLSASDVGSGVQWMRFSNDGETWTSWMHYSSRYPWNIADYHYGGRTGQTTYTVYAQFKDEQGNPSAVYNDTIQKTTGTPGNIILNGVYYETIRDAIAAAEPGDTVYLTDGTYTIDDKVSPPRYPSEHVGIVLTPGVTLKGAGADRTKLIMEDGDKTVIDADNSVIEGLTIEIADPPVSRAVLLESESSQLKNCIIQSTSFAIMIEGNNNLVANNVIINSETGIYNIGSNCEIYNNAIVHNFCGIASGSDTDAIKNNIIAYNQQGVYVLNTADFRNNDVFSNTEYNYPDSDPHLLNQTGINGNICENPLFTSDYHLSSGSPAIDAGTDVGIPFTGSAPDMGAFEYGATGTIEVASSLGQASFNISGPQDYSGSGQTWSVSNAPIGLYSIEFDPISDCYTPQYEVKTLMSDQTIVFNGNYAEDNIPPCGTISVNFDEYATGDNVVDIALSFTDAVAGLGSGAQMMFSNDGTTWSSPEPFSTLKQDWDLTAYGGNADPGSKTVYAKVSDALGNWMSVPATDTILYVPDRQILEVPSQYSTIQVAINAAQAGDIVHVLPGDYQEDITLKEGVRLQGSGHWATSLRSTIHAADDSMVDGFTISEPGLYRGIMCDDASPIISNNVIHATGGIQILGDSDPIIRNNVISECSLAIMTSGQGQGSTVIENNAIVGNDEGIYLVSAVPSTHMHVTNNIIANNSRAITDTQTGDEHTHIFSSFNLFWNNTAKFYGDNKDEISCAMDIDADPLFVDPASGDFTLQSGSPGINSGHPESRYNDVDGTRNDRGAYGGRTANTPPFADFSLSSSQGSPATIFVFNASLSHDRESDEGELYFRWDWDGDGSYDTNFTTEKVATHQYETLGTKTINPQVRDKGGFISVATKQLDVINQLPNTPYDPSPANGSLSLPVGVTLSWSCEDPDPGDTLTYDVYLGVDSDLDLQLVSSNQTATTYAPSTLQHEKSYYWKVVATDSHGASVSSPVWSFSTESEPIPNSLCALGAEVVSTSQIDINWTDKSNNELGFKIERKIGTDDAYAQLCTVGANVTSFNDTGLVEGSNYYYRACAYGSSGNSSYSNEANATTWMQPVSSFTMSSEGLLIGQVGHEIAFDASSSFDPDGTIASWEWEFGDGDADYGETVEHAYSNAGNYTVNLTVTDNNGMIDTTSETITIVKVGDVNSDGEINASDITEEERIIFGLDNPTPGADANQDGEISCTDITEIELIIAPSAAPTVVVATFTASTDDANGTSVAIDAPTEVYEGESFVAKVQIGNVTDFDACNFDVTFDNSVLWIRDVTAGNISGTSIPVDLWGEITAGTIRVIENVPGTSGVSGSSYLANIHFQVIGSPGDISPIDLHNCVLGDKNAQVIPATLVDSSVQVLPCIPGIGPINDIEFGDVGVGGSLDRTTSIYNDGDATLTIGNVTRVSGSSDFAYVGPSTPFDIGGGGSQDITIRFEPSSVESRSATFNVTSNDPDEPQAQFSTSGNRGIIPGDANLDGSVDVLDVTAIQMMILGYLVDLTVTSDGCCPIDVSTSMGGGGTVPAGETMTFYNLWSFETATVSADDTDPVCAFDSWSDGGGKTHDIAMALGVDVSVTANCTIVAPVP